MTDQPQKFICEICDGMHPTSEHAPFAPKQVAEFFNADIGRTKKRETDIREVKERLNEYLEPFELSADAFEILVTSSEGLPAPNAVGEFKPFYNVALVEESVFEQAKPIRDAVILHEYSHGLVDPVGRPFMEKHPDITQKVRMFLEEWKKGRIPWSIPNSDSDAVKEMWREYAGDAGIFSWEQTCLQSSQQTLENFFSALRTDPSYMADLWLGTADTSAKQKSDLHLTAYGCALGEKLIHDWKFASARAGAWDIDYEEGVCNYLAAEITGVSMDEMQQVQKQDAPKINAATFLQRKFRQGARGVIEKIKAGASVMDLFRED